MRYNVQSVRYNVHLWLCGYPFIYMIVLDVSLFRYSCVPFFVSMSKVVFVYSSYVIFFTNGDHPRCLCFALFSYVCNEMTIFCDHYMGSYYALLCVAIPR